MICQHVNKRTTMLSLATSHTAHSCTQLNHVALPISRPRFKSIICYQNSPKIKLFLQKHAKFLSAGGTASRPPASGGWKLFPQTPSLRRLGALPSDSQWLRRLGALPQDPPNHTPHCKFLATRLAKSIYASTK